VTYPAKGYGTFGPRPWQQTSWDWRAAGNFMGGGVGSGLIVFTAVSGVGGIHRTVLLLAALAFVALGLLCVAAELGRPLRALNVFRNPRTSWMAREAWTSVLLFPAGLVAAAGIAGFVWIAAALALAFVYCQAWLLQAAKGIPAWREPLLRPLLVMTGLAEGAGVFLLAAPVHGVVAYPVLLAFGVLLLARFALWLAYRGRLNGVAAPGALAALDSAGRPLVFLGTAVPLVLVAGAAFGGAFAPTLIAVAGLLAAFAGAFFKLVLVTRAGFNQGFALVHAPVRGVRR